MDQLPLTPANLEQASMPEVDEQVSENTRRPWIFVGILALIVVVLLAAVIWRLEQRRSETLQGSLQTAEQIVATDAVVEPLPQALLAQPEEVLTDLESLQNPIFSQPCFVTGEKTCQYTFNRNQLSGNDVRIQYLQLPKRQERQDLFFLFSRMLVLRGETSQAYTQSLLSGIEPQPYLTLVEDAYKAGLENNINPAFIYTLYELAYTSSKKLDLPAGDITRYVLPKNLAQSLRSSLDDPARMNQTPLGAELNKKDWTPESKAAVYVLAQSYHPAVVADILAQQGAVEQKYYELFHPSELLGEFTINLSESPVPGESVFAQPQESLSNYDFAVCRSGKVYVCSKDGSQASCSAFPFYDYFCTMLTNIP